MSQFLPFRRWAGLAALAGSLSLASAASAQMRIAVVDTQRAVMETEDGLRAQATLKKLFDSRQKELDKKQKELQVEREALEKQKDTLAQAEMQKRIEKWQQAMNEVQSVFVEYNRELQKKQNELTQPIVQKTVAIIRRLATKDGFDAVIEKQAAPYFRSDLDLTDRVITAYNNGGNVDAPAKAPKAAAPAAPTAPAAAQK
jgi:outer membrane protein